MVLWLIESLLDYVDPQKLRCEITGRYNGFLLLKTNILSIQSGLFSLHAMLLEHQ